MFRVKGNKPFLHLGEESLKRKKMKHVTASQFRERREGSAAAAAQSRALPWLPALLTALTNNFRILNHEQLTVKSREK